MFRDLRADEIECRVAQAKKKGVSLLLYKDARCDMNILDETFGAMNWTRHHLRDNANCVVSIWDGEKQQWISKEDTGTESNTEKEKGLASDSFKRACFNWGIGRELYTAPFIWVKAENCSELKEEGGRWKCVDRFYVSSIAIENKRIVGLIIKNAKTKKVAFQMGKEEAPVEEPAPEFKRVSDIPNNPKCSCCHKTVKPIVKDGVVKKTAEEVIAWSNETWGVPYCWDCAKKQRVGRNSNDIGTV